MTSPRCKYGVEHGECGKSSGVGQQWDRQISQEDNEVVFVENDGGGESELFELPCTKEMRMRCVNSSDGDSGTYLSTLNTARKMTAYVAFDSQVRRTAAIKRRVAIADPEHRLDLLRKEDRTTGDKLRVCLKRESLHKPASLLSLWCDTENIDECRPRAPTLEGTDVNSVAPKSDDGCSIRFKCDMDQKPFSGITTTYEQSNRPIQQALLSYENYGDDFARMRSTGKKFKPAHSGDRMSADFLIAGDQTFDQVGGQRALDTESLDVSSLQKSKKNILVYNESLAALDSRRAASLKNKTRAEIYPELPIPTINFCRSGPQSPHRAAKRPHVSELRIRKIGQTGTGILPLDQETTGSASRSASFVGSRPAHWEKRPRVIQTSRGRVSEAEVSEHENALLRMRKSALAYATKKRTKDPFWKETNQLDKRTDRGSTCSIDVDCRSIKFGPSFFTPSGNRRRCQVYDGMLTDSCDSFSSNRLLDNSDNKKRNEDEYEIATSVPNTASTHAPKGNGKWNCVATRSRRCLDAPGNSDQRLQTKGVEIWSLASRLLLLRAQTEEGLRFRIHPFRFLRTKQVEDTDDSTNRHATKI